MMWRKTDTYLLPQSGLLFLFIIIAPLLTALHTQAQTEGREPIGSRECRSCHRGIGQGHSEGNHALTFTSADSETARLLADFSVGQDIRVVQFPGESQSRPFEQSDIAYVVGSGRNIQRYVTQLDENVYQVLPAEWNIQNQAWEPYQRTEAWPTEAYDWSANCAFCHTTTFNAEDLTWEEDGVQCEACHGPGSIHLEVVEDIRDVPSVRQRRELDESIEIGLDSQICGQCHSQGHDPISDTPYPADYQRRDTLVDNESYALVPAEEPFWLASGHAAQPNMQFNEWYETGHASSFNDLVTADNVTPACLSCHNITYQRAERVLRRIEIEEDEDALEIFLLDDADLDVDIDELATELLSELSIDPQRVDATQPILPQVLPYLIDYLNSEEILQDTTVISQQLAAIIQAIEAGESLHPTTYGVTCASCHSMHTPAENTSQLVSEDYVLCTSCHQQTSSNNGIHHPVREVFEGQPLIAEVKAVPGAHFTADEGPICTTCHMPQVNVGDGARSSHRFQIIAPEFASQIGENLDTCSTCHGEEIIANSLQDLIHAIQNDTRDRLDLIKNSVDEDTATWITDLVAIVEGDGSFGVHNFGYVDVMLNTVEEALGLKAEAQTVMLPELVTTATPEEETNGTLDQNANKLTIPSIIFLALCTAILLYAAYAFFVREEAS